MNTRISILAGLLCLPVMAGDDGRQEEWMKELRAKEAKRAVEAAQYVGNIEELEKKYGWLKENDREKYDDMINKSKAAAREWQRVAEQVGRARDQEEISALKLPAYRAGAIAELARLELKAAGSEREWKRSAEKSGSDEVERLARKLIENQRRTIETTTEKLVREHQLRELALERGQLEKEMREQYEKARNKERERDRGHDKPQEPQRPPHKEEPKPPAPPDKPGPIIE